MAMKKEAPSKSPSWTARSLRPVVVAYVALVFCAFIAVAHFVLHSTKAVTALATTGIGSVIALVPTMLARSEYQLTETGVAKRLVSRNKTRRFEEVFRWEDLSHLAPTSTGFKYFKKLAERRPIARFFKLHFSNNYSGEIHVEDKDRSLVRALLLERGVRLSGRPARDRPPRCGRG